VGVTTSICVGCGLCCDGTVLSHIAVADESDLGWPLRVLGVELIVQSDPPVFALPCPAVRDGVCTVYDSHRPSACAQFSCDLLTALEEGRIDVEDARVIIGETLRVRDGVRTGTAGAADLGALVRAHFRAAPT
jgi:hypothetical protein